MTKPKAKPAMTPELSMNDQIAAFFAKGGKVQEIPESVGAGTILTRRETIERTARQSLGGKNGSASKAANYASSKARKPKDKSQIILNRREEADDE